MNEIILEDRLSGVDLACYDKYADTPSYIINGDSLDVQVVETALRVHVPMTSAGDPDALVFLLIQTLAKKGERIGYDKSFASVHGYFHFLDLPFATIIKNPTTRISIPSNVAIVDYPAVPIDRFYCSTSPALLGRLPTRHDERGYLVFNPRGVLTVLHPTLLTIGSIERRRSPTA